MARKPKDEIEPATTDNVEPEPAATPEGVKVMLFCSTVFLPRDLLSPDWASAPTKKYQGKTDEKRTRLTVHPALAAFLEERKQAEAI
jgi:hypothetical protein